MRMGHLLKAHSKQTFGQELSDAMFSPAAATLLGMLTAS